MKTKSPRIIYYDMLNIFACFSVICLHHNGVVHTFPIDSSVFKQALVFETIFFGAVPLFFMLSGATLVDYHDRYSTKDFFLKRTQRVVIPFVSFSIMSMLWNYYIGAFALEA